MRENFVLYFLVEVIILNMYPPLSYEKPYNTGNNINTHVLVLLHRKTSTLSHFALPYLE